MRMALFAASALVLAPCAVGLFGSAWLIGPVPAALALPVPGVYKFI